MANKVSANFEDKNRIREWAAVGKTPAEIENLVKVDAGYIEKFLAVEAPEPVEVSKEENDTDEQHSE